MLFCSLTSRLISCHENPVSFAVDIFRMTRDNPENIKIGVGTIYLFYSSDIVYNNYE